MFGIEEEIPLEEFREKVQDYIQLVDTPNSNGDIYGTFMYFSIVGDEEGDYGGCLLDMEYFDFVYPDDYILVWSQREIHLVCTIRKIIYCVAAYAIAQRNPFD
jgi:hypothetical protein